MSGINLLKKNEAQSVEDVRLKRYVYTASVVGFSLLLLVSLAVFFISLSVSKKYEDYSEIEKSWVSKISSVSETESLNLVLKRKLEAIKKVKSPIDFEEVFRALDSSSGAEVSIISLNVNSDGLMSVDGDSSSSTALMSFIDGLISDLGGSMKSAVIDNLILSKDGNYKFSLALEFVKSKQK